MTFFIIIFFRTTHTSMTFSPSDDAMRRHFAISPSLSSIHLSTNHTNPAAWWYKCYQTIAVPELIRIYNCKQRRKLRQPKYRYRSFSYKYEGRTDWLDSRDFLSRSERETSRALIFIARNTIPVHVQTSWVKNNARAGNQKSTKTSFFFNSMLKVSVKRIITR